MRLQAPVHAACGRDAEVVAAGQKCLSSSGALNWRSLVSYGQDDLCIWSLNSAQILTTCSHSHSKACPEERKALMNYGLSSFPRDACILKGF